MHNPQHFFTLPVSDYNSQAPSIKPFIILIDPRGKRNRPAFTQREMAAAAQYDAIGARYRSVKTLATSMVEEENMHAAVRPYLAQTARPRVLDLACGTGYYARKAVDWGAAYVLGIDQSRAMVDAARDEVQQACAYQGRIHFQLGDALCGGKVKRVVDREDDENKKEEEEEEPFDMVLGCWLLNYAASLAEMTQMFKTIAANLKPGGVFVGLTPAATDDVDSMAAAWPRIQARFPDDFPVRVHYYERLASGEGWKTKVCLTADNGGGDRIAFCNFHLHKSVYEQGARLAGFRNTLQWRDVDLSATLRVLLQDLGWTAYLQGPESRNIGVVVVEK